ncbi:MAG: 30S ribosomal protein S8 [Chloroflexota bacterium]|nr:30S ribosomal protein S8 [Chloroflexota bacterium]
MQTTDPIADMLTRIRNASMARHQMVTMPTSRMKQNIAAVLQQEGYIGSYTVTPSEGVQPNLQLELLYDQERQPGIRGIRRVSKPGLRVYAKTTELPRVLGGIGTSILSTPNGVVSGQQARAQKVGGEVLCYVW